MPDAAAAYRRPALTTEQLERQRRATAQTRREYVKRGMCPYCYGLRPAEPGKEACRPCRDVRNRRYNNRRQERIAAGLCEKCGKPRDGEGLRCRACAEARNAIHARWYERQKQAGRCIACGGPSRPGKILCAGCAKEGNARNNAGYHAKAALRPTCTHERWHLDLLAVVDTGDQGVKLLRRMTCRRCRKVRQETFWARPERLAALFGVGSLEEAA